jgi:hypothetical protein
MSINRLARDQKDAMVEFLEMEISLRKMRQKSSSEIYQLESALWFIKNNHWMLPHQERLIGEIIAEKAV